MSAQPTPRPWKGCAHVEGTDPECPCRYRGDVSSVPADQVVLQLGVGPDHPDGRDDGSGWRSIPTTDLETGYANGRLIVAAVNDYDRLRAIEAAYEALLTRVEQYQVGDFGATLPGPDEFAAAWAALARPAEEERG